MLYLWGIGDDFYNLVKWNNIIIDDDVVLVDVSENKIGTSTFDHIIQSPDCLKNGLPNDALYITSSRYKNDILCCVNKYNSDIRVIDNKNEALWLLKKNYIRKCVNIEKEYISATSRDIYNWVKNAIGDECEYWDNAIPQYVNSNHPGLAKREFRYPYAWELNVKNSDVVVDIGSGPIPIFGNMINGEELSYIPMDPLAYQYDRLNEKYHVQVPVKTQFGIMELLSYFVGQESIDICIIHNALDHSIDIMRAFIECIISVKVGGCMLLSHLEAEAIHNNYSGLHKWNIEENNGELIFFNEKSCVNVTKLCSDFADIAVRREHISLKGWEYRDLINCKIVKKKKVPFKIIEQFVSEKYVSDIVSSLFSFLN